MQKEQPSAILDDIFICKTKEDEIKRKKVLIYHLAGNVKGKKVVTHDEITAQAVKELGGEPSKEKGDIGIIDDVLDHIEISESESLLKSTNVWMLYVRCHPWCSRHATHNWQQPAYEHLLNKNCSKHKFHNGLRINDYESLFKKCGWTIKNQLLSIQDLEKYFDNIDLPYEKREMEIQFMDFQLEKSPHNLMV